jgi:hypothetical protein
VAIVYFFCGKEGSTEEASELSERSFARVLHLLLNDTI